MKLLIVDDFPGVVNGLVQGVPWAEIGIGEVLTAQNAMEARAALLAQNIDIMLCDIEMPVESGVQLFKWMRDEKIKTLCIFLTSHAEFQYAQEAIKLGAFDYVVQPAPYAEVRRVVEKAVAHIHSTVEKDKMYTMGDAFSKQVESIVANVQRDYLLGIPNQRGMETVQQLGHMPQGDVLCQLVLVQIARWNSCTESWEGPFLAQALSNIVREIFIAPLQVSVVSFMGENCFSLILYSEEADAMNQEALARQLLYLNSVCEQYIHCSIACYLAPLEPMKQLPATWQLLCAQRDENVALHSGAFFWEKPAGPPAAFHMPKIQHWGNLLREDYPLAMEEEAFTLLDEMMENNKLTTATLRNFYQDFLQMLYGIMEGKGDVLEDLFSGKEALELYRNGMKTVDQMKAMVHHVALHYDAAPPVVEQQAMVRQVTNYIDNNLESELRRDEIAAHVHLNADYLTRIFKKETGVTLKEYITQQKMREAQSLLRTTNLPVGFIAAKLGYCNFSHFSYTYKKLMGIPPGEERRTLESEPL